MTAARRNGLGLLGAGIAFLLWLALSWHSTSLFFPPLHRILEQAASHWLSGEGLRNIATTFSTLIQGLLSGLLAGAVAGIAIGRVRFLDRALTPLIEFGRSIPQVALIPFAISLFGIGAPMQVFIVALSGFWPVLLNTSEGVRHLPRLWDDTARAFGLTPFQKQLWIILPGLAPRILTAIHVALPLCLIVTVTSEMIGATSGIGATILNAQYTYDVPLMWSGVIVLGVIGCVLNLLFVALESAVRRYIPNAH